MKTFFNATLRGLGQIMFQDNRLSGLLFVIAIALHSVTMAGAALLGSGIGTLWAKICRYTATDMQQGLYGFNSALVAIAVSFFYHQSAYQFVLLLLGCVFSTWLMHAMLQRKLSAYTFPFVFTTWIIFALAPQQVMQLDTVYIGTNDLLNATLQGFAEVMFQSNSWTGLIFILAILVNNRSHALWSTLAAAFTVLCAQLLSWSSAETLAGLYSYNAVLTAIAILGISSHKWLVMAGVVLSLILTKIMFVLGLAALTFPFILATWIFAYGHKHWPRGSTK